jgi:hypothetical protein
LTTALGANPNSGGTSSTQTNGGNLHQSPSWAPSLVQVIQGNAELDQSKCKTGMKKLMKMKTQKRRRN